MINSMHFCESLQRIFIFFQQSEFVFQNINNNQNSFQNLQLFCAIGFYFSVYIFIIKSEHKGKK